MNRMSYKSPILTVIVWLFMLSGIAVTPAVAGTITYSFKGTVNQVGSTVSSGFTNPSSMDGSITVVNHSPTPGNTATYTISGFTVNIGGLGGYTANFGALTNGHVDIRNGSGGGGSNVADRFEVTVNSPNGGPVNFQLPRLFEINLRGPASQWTTNALPTNPIPSIASFTGAKSFRLQFGPGNGPNGRVSGLMTSLTAVPLPPGAILFGIGLVALIGLGAGGLRNLRSPQA